MKITRWITAFALTCTLAIAGLARADAEPKVNDQAHFFKSDTIDKVDAEVKQVKADTNIEIVVESFEGVPDNLKEAWDASKDDASQKHEFYQKWIESRGKELKLSGVYVLVVRNPGHVEVMAGRRTHERAMPHDDQAKMTQILLDSFKAKQFDEGLQKAIDFARDTIKQNLNGEKQQATAGYDPIPRGGGGGEHRVSASLPPSAPAPTPVPQQHGIFFGTCMWIGLIVIGAIVLMSIFSRRSSSGGWSNQGYGGPGYGGGGYGPGPSRGGGFFSGLFGGLLGGAAGSYFENRMENRNQPNTNTYSDNNTSTGGDTSGSGGGQSDFGSTGGDFGSSSSSSSDAGSTGGDFGGGGGDSGGGGGSSGGDF